jgi:Tfp pilus assembly protein FimV
MKRSVFVGVLLAGLCSSVCSGQDSPADAAARQETEERIKTMSARIEDLEQGLQACKRELGKLNEELRNLRDDLARANNNNKDAAFQKSLEQLADAIKEVDKKRIADDEKNLAVLKALKESLSDRPTGGPRPNPAPAVPKAVPDPVRGGPEKGYEYSIQQGDTLLGIVGQLARQGIKVTQKQMMDANPGVNWNRLRIGQKIFIPAPAKP